MQALAALLSGLVFGLGLIVSGMFNPAKVLGFLDLAGRWDPSLAFVMAGAIAVGLPAFAWARRRKRSLLGAEMQLPTARHIDRRLIAGSLLFGTGSSLMLLPVLVYCYGPKQAVPIMAVAAILANVARVAAWWRQVDWKAVAAYAIPGAPAAALGARTLLSLPAGVIDSMLGLFFLAMLALRRWRGGVGRRLRLRELAVAGAAIGFLTGLVLSTGPLSVPVFSAYGLTGGAFLATEAASALALYVSKVTAFRQLGALPASTLLQGLLVGSSLMAGTFAGKSLVVRMSPAVFSVLIDGLMLCSGLSLLWAAWR